jgi:hypothetical protein
MQAFVEKLQALDRRWIYLLLSLVLIVSLIVGKQVDPVVIPPVEQLYKIVDDTPTGPGEGKIIVLCTTFSASTLGENGNHAIALMRHCFLKKKRFAITAVGEAQGALLGRAIATQLAEQYGAEYGVDWIDFDFQLNTLAFYTSFPKDIPGTVRVDGVQGKPLTSYPIMQGIDTINDVALLIDITASNSVFSWLQYVQPNTKPRLKIGYACTGVMVAEAYPFLDSGQLVGMLPGLKGASDYEKLVDVIEEQELAAGNIPQRYEPIRVGGMQLNTARQLMFTQDKAHILIIAFIALGNIGLFIALRLRRRAGKERS